MVIIDIIFDSINKFIHKKEQKKENQVTSNNKNDIDLKGKK